MYGNFGVPALLYLAWANYLALAVPTGMRPHATAAIAILGFDFGYGAVLGMLEDPFTALFLGASLGTLWRLRQLALNRKWSNAFTPTEGYPMSASRPLESGQYRLR
jgi:hypothetical protein